MTEAERDNGLFWEPREGRFSAAQGRLGEKNGVRIPGYFTAADPVFAWGAAQYWGDDRGLNRVARKSLILLRSVPAD